MTNILISLSLSAVSMPRNIFKSDNFCGNYCKFSVYACPILSALKDIYYDKQLADTDRKKEEAVQKQPKQRECHLPH